MTNEQLIKKMKEDMNMRNFSKYTYDSYLGKTRDIMRYYGEKQLEEITTEELREFLLKHLKEKRKLSDRSIGVRIDIWTHLMRECIINYVY